MYVYTVGPGYFPWSTISRILRIFGTLQNFCILHIIASFFCLVQFDLAVGSVHEVCTLRKKTGPMEIHFCVVSQTDVAESQYGLTGCAEWKKTVGYWRSGTGQHAERGSHEH